MKPLPHRYDVKISAGPSGHAILESPGVPKPGDAWSPEQLLMGAVASCFLLTFRVIAQGSKIEYASLEVTGEGVVDRADGVMRFTEIVLRPRLSLPAGADRVRVERALEKAKRSCLISASLTPLTRLEPEIMG